MSRLFMAFVLVGVGTANLVSQDATGDGETDFEALSDQFRGFAELYLGSTTPVQLVVKGEASTFGHLSRPWETRSKQSIGRCVIDSDQLTLQQTWSATTGNTETTTVYSSKTLFRIGSDGNVVDTTVEDHELYLRTSCRYTPQFLLRHVLRAMSETARDNGGSPVRFSREQHSLVVAGKTRNENYEIHFETDEGALQKIVWHRHHEMWGDQAIHISYSRDRQIGKTCYPFEITEETFAVTTYRGSALLSREPDQANLISIPVDYELSDSAEVDESVIVDKYSDRITFLHLVHTDSRTTVVEFDEYLVVIDAPISSNNGELILDKVSELQPGKPVRYFMFGHHHPHYLGGVRPFVAAGATVLANKKVVAYVEQLARFEHTLNPDQLQTNPAPLKVESFEERTRISDGEYSMDVFDIGLNSKHTIDYLLFYFPEEKMILQGDGIWLKPGEPINERTRATCESIRNLKLPVVECVQGWPVSNYGVPTKIRFDELEAAISRFDQQESDSSQKIK